MQTYFLAGIPLIDKTTNEQLGWMAEGLFLTEQACLNFIKNINNKHVFLTEASVGKLPNNCMDAIKMYWPLQETWETSTLYKIRNGIIE